MAVAECVAWRQSGCNPELAGRDPGAHASIVDVSDLADGITEHPFDFRADPAGLAWGWVTVEFATADCKPIGARRRLDNQMCQYAHCSSNVVIPEAARWMTISSRQDNIVIRWTLS